MSDNIKPVDPVEAADLVEAIFLALYDNQRFKSLLTEVIDELAVEGSIFFDDLCATLMIGDAAPDDSPLKDIKLATLRVILTEVVMCRYGISRRERPLGDDLPRLTDLQRRNVPGELERLAGLDMESASSARDRARDRPWVPRELPPRQPEPVPELGWCARCKLPVVAVVVLRIPRPGIDTLVLERNRARRPDSPDYGTYGLIKVFRHHGERRVLIVAGNLATGYGLDLNQVEEYLKELGAMTTKRDWHKHIIPTALRIHSELKNGAQGVAPTLRQIHYQLFSAPELLALSECERYRDTDADTNTLSRITAQMPRAGTFPAVSEPGRWIRTAGWNRSAGEAIGEIAFRSDRFGNLDANVFIGCEKAAIATQLEQWFLDPYHIPVVPSGGSGSQTILDDAVDLAVEYRETYDRPNVFIYAGDFDAKGVDIRRDCTKRAARAFEPGDIHRVAMTVEQKRANPQWWLRGNPDDTSAWKFLEEYGFDAIYNRQEVYLRWEPGSKYKCDRRGFARDRHGELILATVKVELDALAPADLRQAFIDGIRRVTSLPDVALASTKAERDEQAKLDLLADAADRYSLTDLRRLLGR